MLVRRDFWRSLVQPLTQNRYCTSTCWDKPWLWPLKIPRNSKSTTSLWKPHAWTSSPYKWKKKLSFCPAWSSHGAFCGHCSTSYPVCLGWEHLSTLSLQLSSCCNWRQLSDGPRLCSARENRPRVLFWVEMGVMVTESKHISSWKGPTRILESSSLLLAGRATTEPAE